MLAWLKGFPASRCQNWGVYSVTICLGHLSSQANGRQNGSVETNVEIGPDDNKTACLLHGCPGCCACLLCLFEKHPGRKTKWSLGPGIARDHV